MLSSSSSWLQGRAAVSLPWCDRFSHLHKTLESCLCELVGQSQYCALSLLRKPGSRCRCAKPGMLGIGMAWGGGHKCPLPSCCPALPLW